MAQNKMKWAPTTNAFQTTLNGAINATATTITLNSVTGLQNKAGILVIDRVNSAGTATPSSREYIYFTGVSGSSVTLPSVGDGRGQGGSTGQSHADGAVVEAIMDVDAWNGLVDSYDVQHNDAGTHAALTTDTFSATSLVSISSSLFVAGQGNFPSAASIRQIDNTTANILTANITNLGVLSLASISRVITSVITPSIAMAHGISSTVSIPASSTSATFTQAFPFAFGEVPAVILSIFQPVANAVLIPYTTVLSPVTTTQFTFEVSTPVATNASTKVAWAAFGKRGA